MNLPIRIFQREDATAHTLQFHMSLQHNTQWKNISKDAVTKVTCINLIFIFKQLYSTLQCEEENSYLTETIPRIQLVNLWKHDTNTCTWRSFQHDTNTCTWRSFHICAVSYANKMHALILSVYNDSWCTGTKNVTSTIIKKNWITGRPRLLCTICPWKCIEKSKCTQVVP